MNLIIDPLPETVIINDRVYDIRTNFRISILFELMMQDDEMSDEEKARQALYLYYPEIPPDPQKAAEMAIWFYRCGKELKNLPQGSGSGEKQPQAYSFEHDADYIYSAFLSQYGIDLAEIEYMHWWKFRALFKSLKEDNEFVRIMGYRTMNITSKMSREQKDFYKRMQKVHALPRSGKEQQDEAAILEALKNGGDLAGIL